MDTSPYLTLLDVKFAPGQAFDIADVVRANAHPWFNQTLCRVNESVVRLGAVSGEYHWHQHQDDDEFFYVVSGRLLIDLADGTIDLRPGQAVVIPKGTPHRPRAPEPTVMLMVETAGIVPTGDA
jgi:mannose-6-phosphate isomerase-like protein (cupin superfamily)